MTTWHISMQRGPWRILHQCKATKHNTISASRDTSTGPRCVCPHAIEIILKRTPNTHRSNGIPWRISDDCEALRHNTARAYLGKLEGPKCTCPPSASYTERRLDRPGRDRSGREPQLNRRKAIGVIALIDENMPDLRRGLCRIPSNLPIVDGGFEDGAKERYRARMLCSGCPVLDTCREWVLGMPLPGSVPGVWGGLDTYERRKLDSARLLDQSAIAAPPSRQIIRPRAERKAVAGRPSARGGFRSVMNGGFAKVRGAAW